MPKHSGPAPGQIINLLLPRLVAVMVAAVFLTGCFLTPPGKQDQQQTENPKYALQIGDQKLTLPQLNEIFASRLGEFADHTEIDQVKSRLLDDLVVELLLDMEAQKAGVVASQEEVDMYLLGMESEKGKEEDAAVKEFLKNEIRRTVRIQRYIKDVLMKGYQPDPAALQQYYADHQQEYQVPESVHVKEILLSSADQAERILLLLKAGQNRNFGQLAKQYSIAPSSANEGDMGFFARGDLPEEMEKVFFNMYVPGKLSPIIQTKYGYHIFMLVERTKERRESFDAVKEQIVNRLSEERQKEFMAEKLRQLRSVVPVVLYRQNIDFSYNGQELQGDSSK